MTLSLAGIYAIMAFTVARRTREIGIRTALGAAPPRVVAAIFTRPLLQVAVGVTIGSLLSGALIFAGFGAVTVNGVAMILGYGALMFLVCTLACIVPTRRALAVEPMEALREEG